MLSRFYGEFGGSGLKILQDKCEQMGEDPDWTKCPPAWEDFPEIVITGLNIFNTFSGKC